MLLIRGAPRGRQCLGRAGGFVVCLVIMATSCTKHQVSADSCGAEAEWIALTSLWERMCAIRIADVKNLIGKCAIEQQISHIPLNSGGHKLMKLGWTCTSSEGLQAHCRFQWKMAAGYIRKGCFSISTGFQPTNVIFSTVIVFVMIHLHNCACPAKENTLPTVMSPPPRHNSQCWSLDLSCPQCLVEGEHCLTLLGS